MEENLGVHKKMPKNEIGPASENRDIKKKKNTPILPI